MTTTLALPANPASRGDLEHEAQATVGQIREESAEILTNWALFGGPIHPARG